MNKNRPRPVQVFLEVDEEREQDAEGGKQDEEGSDSESEDLNDQ